MKTTQAESAKFVVDIKSRLYPGKPDGARLLTYFIQ